MSYYTNEYVFWNKGQKYSDEIYSQRCTFEFSGNNFNLISDSFDPCDFFMLPRHDGSGRGNQGNKGRGGCAKPVGGRGQFSGTNEGGRNQGNGQGRNLDK